MLETQLNMFDIAVFTILGLSALLSFFRGFVREVLSLGAWVVAAIITLYVFPDVAAMIKPHVKSTMIASGFASMGTFMISLLLISIFTSMLMKFMKSGSDIGLLDNGLGLIFGLARGAMLVSVGYFVMTLVMSEEEYPDFVKSAISKPYAEKGAKLLASIAPDYLDKLSPLKDEAKNPEDALNADEMLDKAVKAKEDATDASENKGYEWDSMQKLQKLIDENKDESPKE